MKGLTSALLGQACRLFLNQAYPDGEATIPGEKRTYLHITDDLPLESLLKAPICQPLPCPAGREWIHGYAFRLGSIVYPNLKVQVIDPDGNGTLVFSIDTHDAALRMMPDDPRATQIQAANRQLKDAVEHAWEAAGLLTFNELLRRQLGA